MSFCFQYPSKGEAHKVVGQLPDEMIKYELESQGIRCDNNYFRRKKQLADVLESRLYKHGRQPVVISYKDDISNCDLHLNAWVKALNQQAPDDRLFYSLAVSYMGEFL